MIGALQVNAFTLAMAVRATAENSVVARFLTIAIGRFNGQTKSQELSHRRRTCRHPVFEAKIVHESQLARANE
jgi:hypothetical protein